MQEETEIQIVECTNCHQKMSFPIRRNFQGMVKTSCPNEKCRVEMEITIDAQDYDEVELAQMEKKENKKDKKGKKDRKERKTGDDDVQEVGEDDDSFQYIMALERVNVRCDCNGTLPMPSGKTVLECVGHEKNCCRGESILRLKEVCLTCCKVLCDHCSENVHGDIKFERCLRVPYNIAMMAFDMYRDKAVADEKHRNDPNVRTLPQPTTCSWVSKQADRYFRVTKGMGIKDNLVDQIRKFMGIVMAQSCDDIVISYRDFLVRYAMVDAQLDGRLDKSGKQSVDKLKFRFSQMNWIQRTLFDWQLAWKYSGNTHDGLFSSAISSVEATHGNNVSHYFMFLRWTFLLNLVLALLTTAFLVVPSLWQANWRDVNFGLILGLGMENTFLFFGGYLAHYKNGWSMDTAWILVQAGVLVFSLLLIMSSVESNAVAQGPIERLYKNEHRRFTALIGSISYNVRSQQEAQQHAQAVFTNVMVSRDIVAQAGTYVDEHGKRVSIKPRSFCMRGPCDWYYIGFLLSYGLMAANVYGIYYITRKEQEGLFLDNVSSSDFANLIVPAIITASKAVGPPILRWITLREFSPLNFESTKRLSVYFWRLLILRMAYCVMVVFAIFTADTDRFTPVNSAIDQSPRHPFNCKCPPGMPSPCPGFLVCRCAETQLGILYYRMILVDLVFASIIPLLWAPFKVCLNKVGVSMGCIKYDQYSGRALAESMFRAREMQGKELQDMEVRQVEEAKIEEYRKHLLTLDGHREHMKNMRKDDQLDYARAKYQEALQMQQQQQQQQQQHQQQHLATYGMPVPPQFPQGHPYPNPQPAATVTSPQRTAAATSRGRQQATSQRGKTTSTAPTKKGGVQMSPAQMRLELERRKREEQRKFQEREYWKATRAEFDPMVNIVDLIYRQMLLWSGVIYSPVIPALVVVWSIILFYVKYFEVKQFSMYPAVLQPLSSQKYTVRLAMVIVIIVSFVPLTWFMTQSSSCGPFYLTEINGDTIGDQFGDSIHSLPNVFRTIVDYLTNTVILWMIIVFLFIYVLTIRRQVSLMDDRKCDVWLQINEQGKERRRLVKELHIDTDSNEKNKKMFKEWEQVTLEEFARKVAKKSHDRRVTADRLKTYIQRVRKANPDFLSLLRLDDGQLFRHFRGHKIKIPTASAEELVKSIQIMKMLRINSNLRLKKL